MQLTVPESWQSDGRIRVLELQMFSLFSVRDLPLVCVKFWSLASGELVRFRSDIFHLESRELELLCLLCGLLHRFPLCKHMMCQALLFIRRNVCYSSILVAMLADILMTSLHNMHRFPRLGYSRKYLTSNFKIWSWLPQTSSPFQPPWLAWYSRSIL